MAQGFIIGMVALGAGLAILQKERSDIAAAQVNKTDGATGVPLDQQSTPPPANGGAFGMTVDTGSTDGTCGGSTSTTPSAPASNIAGVGAVSVNLDGEQASIESSSEVFGGRPTGPSSTAPSESTASTASHALPPPPSTTMPSTSYRDYLLRLTYGGDGSSPPIVTPREESDNLAAIGPSVGAIW